MATGDSVKVLDQYAAVPPPGTTVGAMSIPLTFLDIIWVYMAPVTRLVFYELPLSRSHFVETYIPKLKDSLSSTLKEFFPLAGSLIIHSDSRHPEIQYTDGDAVSIIFAESYHHNFKHLTSNCPRKSCEFQPLVPQLPPPSSSNETSSRIVPLLALQVTLFPGVGISIGITNHHTAGDGNSIFSFVKAWALNSQLGENVAPVGSESRPLYDRSVIKDPKGVASLFWNQLRSLNLHSRGGNLPTPAEPNKIRQTFVLGPTDIQKLKSFVYAKRPAVKHLSSFTVTCAFVWTCLVKCPVRSRKVENEDELELFAFPADCRSRVDPPIPANYFGNCLIFCSVEAKKHELLSDEGFPLAAEKFGESLNHKFQNKDDVLKDADTWITRALEMDFERAGGVAGSPRYNYYNLDFGWGKPIKVECTSIDETGAISLSSCRDSEGGIEIGVSFSPEKFETFANAFNEGLAGILS